MSSSDGKDYELKGVGELSIPSEERLILSRNTEFPNTFALNQNYPNPFNPTTNISYSIELKSYVNLTIYDLNGREVQQLVNESQSAGNKTIIWNGKDEFGKPVSAGVYLYKIQADKFIETRKMILMK